MGFSLAQILILGFIGACLFMGPKKIIPRISETLKLTKEVLSDESAKAVETASKEVKKPTQNNGVPNSKTSAQEEKKD